MFRSRIVKRILASVCGISMVLGSVICAAPEGVHRAKAAEETYGAYTSNCSSSDYPNSGKAVEVRFRNTETGNTDVYLIEAYRKSTDANIKGTSLTTQRSFYLKTEHISGNGEFNFSCPSYTTLKFAEDGKSYAVMDLPCTIDVPAYLRQLGNGANAGVPDIAYGGRFGANTYNRDYAKGSYTMPREVKTSKLKRNIQLQINIANFRIVESTANMNNKARQTWCFQYNKVGISFFANGAISNSTTGYSVVNNVVNAAGSRYYQCFTYDGKSAINLVNASTLGLVKRGYHFVDWYSDNTAQRYNQDTNYSNSILYNNWTSNKAVNVTNVDDGKGLNGSSSMVAGGNMWAQWAPDIYHITYNLDGGTVSGNPSSYNIETSTFTLKNPTKEGYEFLGWIGSNGSTQQTTVTIPKGSTGDKSYTAIWLKNRKNYQLSFDLNGGSILDNGSNISDFDNATTRFLVQEQLAWKEKAVEADKTNQWRLDLLNAITPVKTGYSFEGWLFADGTKFTGNEIATKDETVYAKWKTIDYKITYVLNGGSDPQNPSTYTVETPTFTLKNPTRSGYTFLGWTGSNGETANSVVSVEKGTSGNLTYVANWKAIDYKITYVLNGGTDPQNPNTYTVETPTFTLKNPTKTGYTFKGWTGSNGSMPRTSVSVLQGTTGNLTFTANWHKNIIKIKKVPIKKMPYLNTVKYINKGSKFEFKVYGSHNKNYKIFWKNSNKKVISLSNKGIAKAKKNGHATVGYQIYNKKTGLLVYGFQIKVNVITTQYKTLNTSKSIKVKNPTFMFDKTLFVGGKFKLGFHNLAKHAKVTYTSSNNQILTVSKKGVAHSRKEGFAYVNIALKQDGITYHYKVHFKCQEKLDF